MRIWNRVNSTLFQAHELHKYPMNISGAHGFHTKLNFEKCSLSHRIQQLKKVVIAVLKRK